jgi:PhnB protein
MVTPYITFAGNCNEALEFYQTVFNSEVLMSLPYGDYVPEGVTAPPANLKDWILHAEMNICDTVFWFADEIAEPVYKGNMIKLTTKVASAQAAQKIFNVLSIDAKITLPPTATFYSSFHAGLTDRYGVSWNIVAEEAPNRV